MAQIHIPKSWRIRESEATPESVYLNRRQILKALGYASASAALAGAAGAKPSRDEAADKVRPAIGDRFADLFPAKRSPAFTLGGRPITDEQVAASYNNFYEFTARKEKVWELAQGYPVDPWKVEVGGLVKKPRTLDLDDIFTRFPLEERLYRFRCVERWAMQIPWVGYPLRALIDFLEPTSEARFVRFETVLDPRGLPGQRKQTWYAWPYVEALRLDEARHELAMIAVGSYGHALPMQHGAPWRVVTPWKYGFKSIKSIVKIDFTREAPETFWNSQQPEEYGFYSNIEPHKPHPRWSQRWEQDIGTEETRETLPFNGYEKEVGSMYTGEEI
ncbi:MAG: protein-methionine-sulfoxide reductase catalytic subunit MsrP [Acidobacteriota bacterium]